MNDRTHSSTKTPQRTDMAFAVASGVQLTDLNELEGGRKASISTVDPPPWS